MLSQLPRAHGDTFTIHSPNLKVIFIILLIKYLTEIAANPQTLGQFYSSQSNIFYKVFICFEAVHQVPQICT